MPNITPKVSVIMPVYNGAAHHGQAIRSVLSQTVQDVELVIANDASTDDSEQVIRGFRDARLKYIPLPENRGADIARLAAIQASNAPLLAMLDQDDEFHPQKIEAHLDYISRNPGVEIAYNSRYDLLCSGRGVWQMFRPPAELGLADLVLGFPISPSELVATRRIINETVKSELPYHGGEIVWFGRQHLAGVRFGFVDRALNYRRHHPGRRYGSIEKNCDEYIRGQNLILDDSRCPEPVRALRGLAHSGSYVIWGTHALAQGEIELGQGFLRKAIALTPALLEGEPSDLAQRFAQFSITDDTRDHEPVLRNLFRDLPGEAWPIAGELEWAIDHGYLVNGALAAIWNRAGEASAYFSEARKRGANVDQAFFNMATYHLSHFETDAGAAATEEAMRRLNLELDALGAAGAGRRLRSSLRLGRAFRDYQNGNRGNVPANVVSAMAGDPSHYFNRGAWSILMRSLLRRSA